MNQTEPTDFGTRYAAAWSSQHPASLAWFYSENGSLSVNGTCARGFMTAFPDMVVKMIKSARTAATQSFVGRGPARTPAQEALARLFELAAAPGEPAILPRHGDLPGVVDVRPVAGMRQWNTRHSLAAAPTGDKARGDDARRASEAALAAHLTTASITGPTEINWRVAAARGARTASCCRPCARWLLEGRYATLRDLAPMGDALKAEGIASWNIDTAVRARKGADGREPTSTSAMRSITCVSSP